MYVFRSLLMFGWSGISVLFIYSTEPSLILRDQAPHLVYLTSWVWHSVSVSVSLSNTPSEVSLVYKFNPSWVNPQTEQPPPQGDLPNQGNRKDRLETLFLWSFWGYRPGTRFTLVKVVMVETDKCSVIVSSFINHMQITLMHIMS